MVKGREVKERIESVEETQKITQAMQMIASSRIKKAQKRIEQARPFINKVEEFLYDMGFCREVIDDRLVRVRKPENAVLLVGITGDRGLCGSYNTNIFRCVKENIRKYRNQGKEVKLDIIGTKGKNHFQHTGYELTKVYEHLSEWPKFMDAREISRDLISRFVVGDTDKVIICYTKYINTVTHYPRTMQILPIPLREHMEEKIREESKGAASGMVCKYIPDFMYEPSLEKIIRSIIPEYIFTRMYGALLESTASEIGARTTAMRKASDNSEELIRNLTNEYHKLRQEEITNEIIEVVSGAESYG